MARPHSRSKSTKASDASAAGEPQLRIVGRAASANPPNRFERAHVEADWEHLASEISEEDLERRVATEFLPDATQSLLATNNSPDVPFRFSMNPYRGCEHGCAYCYARPSHEMLGMGAGIDFETKIMYKSRAGELLRRELNRPAWQCEMIALSGNTDCYQPAERRFRLTRSLLEVALEARQPIGIITKNALVLRDLDLLVPMAQQQLVHVALSVTTLDADLARDLEPRTSTPAARLRAIEVLHRAGVPTQAMIAPVIPGLTDSEMPALLEAVAAAGAGSAGYVLLRLPLAVRPIFVEWLASKRPQLQERIEALIRETRGGNLSDPRFGERMSGQGSYAEQIAQTFKVFARKYKLDGRLPPFNTKDFRPPRDAQGQRTLF